MYHVDMMCFVSQSLHRTIHGKPENSCHRKILPDQSQIAMWALCQEKRAYRRDWLFQCDYHGRHWGGIARQAVRCGSTSYYTRAVQRRGHWLQQTSGSERVHARFAYGTGNRVHFKVDVPPRGILELHGRVVYYSIGRRPPLRHMD